MNESCDNSEARTLSGKNILVGASGSVASIRIPRLLSSLLDKGANVRLITTKCAQHFIEREDSIPNDVEIFTDQNEWELWKQLSDPILHIELRKWAHLFIIAPASANVIAKLSNGLCDNLLTCVARAWPLNYTRNSNNKNITSVNNNSNISGDGDNDNNNCSKPFIIAPAMNTFMWHHPITHVQIDQLEQFGIHVISPISKKLACGDIGIGAMEDISNIISKISKILQ